MIVCVINFLLLLDSKNLHHRWTDNIEYLRIICLVYRSDHKSFVSFEVFTVSDEVILAERHVRLYVKTLQIVAYFIINVNDRGIWRVTEHVVHIVKLGKKGGKN